MHRNIYWYVFITTLSLIVLWYSGKFLYAYYDYTSLDARAPASSISWSVQGITDEKYHLKADYSFPVNGHLEFGETLLTDHNYWNPKAAEKDIPEYSKRKWIVWYNSSKPHHSTLEKQFPLKECLYTLVLWVLLGYFFWLSNYAIHLRR